MPSASLIARVATHRSGVLFPGIAAFLWITVALGCASEPDPSASTADPDGRGGDVIAGAAATSNSATAAGAAADSPTTAVVDSVWTPPRPRSLHERQRERERMVEVILDKSPMVTDGAVIRAMMDAPRHVFVHEQTRRIAYDDTPLPIGLGQTISQPYIVAYMTELLEIDSTSKVLEIGTGSGYQAAVLAHITPHVYTMEIIELLLDRARSLLAEEGYDAVQTRHGDGYYGWPEAGPYDAIIVTCAAGHLPPLLWSQLKTGGRIVIPIGEMTGVQRLVVVRKTSDGERTSRTVMPVRFVPMTGRVEQ